jgi:truncated hemoglobin YjbI
MTSHSAVKAASDLGIAIGLLHSAGPLLFGRGDFTLAMSYLESARAALLEEGENSVTIDRTPDTSQDMSLFQRLNGRGSLEAVSRKIYDAVLGPEGRPDLADKVLGPMFRPYANRRGDFRTHIEQKLSGVLVGVTQGQPVNVDRLASAHAYMGITHTHFDRLVDIVQQSLIDLGVPERECKEMHVIVESLRSKIVTA